MKLPKIVVRLVVAVSVSVSFVACASRQDDSARGAARESFRDSPSDATASPALADARPTVPAQVTRDETLALTFAGDIMSHTVNFEMRDYDRIYDDVRLLLKSDDLSFANFEAPIHDGRPLSTYPRFNAHTPYLVSAVNGGFDVLSLANNHANDQGTEGIARTRESTARLAPALACSGLRAANGEPMRPVVLQKNGWTVLFLAVTEILNSYDSAGKLVYRVPQTESGRAEFLAALKAMRAEHPCDLFVLSLHSGEAEYGRTASEAKKAWFAEIERAGVDILWAHHPHVMQDWHVADVDGRTCLTMYSTGNFVSGQRFDVNLADPAAYREYTGDSVLLRVTLKREPGTRGFGSMSAEAIPVTNWNDPAGGVVVRRFTRAFVDGLPPVWKDYYLKRYDLMRAYLPSLPVLR